MPKDSAAKIVGGGRAPQCAQTEDVRGRFLGCSDGKTEEGILGHGPARVHVLEKLWHTPSRRCIGGHDVEADRVVSASSGWTEEVLRLCGVHERAFQTNADGPV